MGNFVQVAEKIKMGSKIKNKANICCQKKREKKPLHSSILQHKALIHQSDQFRQTSELQLDFVAMATASLLSPWLLPSKWGLPICPRSLWVQVQQLSSINREGEPETTLSHLQYLIVRLVCVGEQAKLIFLLTNLSTEPWPQYMWRLDNKHHVS